MGKNQVTFKGRNLVKDTASNKSFLKTFDGPVIRCAKHQTGNKRKKVFIFWCVADCPALEIGLRNISGCTFFPCPSFYLEKTEQC